MLPLLRCSHPVARFLPTSSRSFSSLTPQIRSQQRLARRNAASSFLKSQGSAGAKIDGNSRNRAFMVVFTALTGVTAWGVFDEGSPMAKAWEGSGAGELWRKSFASFIKPHSASLLPSWPMPNVPQDLPCPHTLVIDLENTLVHSTWDRKYGWRHAKRPGVDKFLSTLAQYYEIVLMSPSLAGVAEPVVMGLDPQQCIMHHLFRESLLYQDGVHMKDLTALNRPMNRIVCIDDDPTNVMQTSNLIRIKPYDNPRDRTDKSLEDLIPLLVEIAKSNQMDVPGVIRGFGTNEATGIVDEYRRRLDAKRDKYIQQSERSLLSRGANKLEAPEGAPQLMSESSKSGLSAKDIAGSEPVPENLGGVAGWWQSRKESKEELEILKRQKWQEVMEKRAKERE